MAKKIRPLLLILLVAPLLTGFYFDAYNKPSVGIHASDALPLNPWDTAAKVNESTATSILVLGVTDWGKVELCLFGLCFYNWTGLRSELDDHVRDYWRVGRAVQIVLTPIFTLERVLPADLASQPFGVRDANNNIVANPVLVDRFKRLYDSLDDMLNKDYPGVPARISLGNEVNFYFERLKNPSDPYLAVEGSREAAVWGYIDLIKQMKAHIAQRSSNRPVGVTTTWQGACGIGDHWHPDPAVVSDCQSSHVELVWGLFPGLDYLSFTYYPYYTRLQPLPGYGVDEIRTEVENNFSLMEWLGDAYDAPVVIQEIGYESFDQTEQVWFIDAYFDAWANHRRRIAQVNYFSLHDFPSDNDSSMWWGLHDVSGNPKPAWDRFVLRASLFNLAYAQ